MVDEPAAQELVERALAAVDGRRLVVVTERSEANLRWAGNTLTTNGEMTSTELTVVATAEVDGGTGVGTVSQQVDGRRARSRRWSPRRRRRRGPSALAEDAAPLVGAVGVRRTTSASNRPTPRSRC